MSVRLDRILVPVGLALVFAACEHETVEVRSGETTTTAAVVADRALWEVAKARCRRADECNRFGDEHKFADKGDCIQGYVNDPVSLGVVTCPNGVDRGQLNDCLAELENQYCDAHLGPVTAMPHCGSYCYKGQ
jgi:hypothetical protein